MKNAIDGKTAVLGLMGDPVAHTLSPLIHNTLSRLLGINAAYLPFHVKGENLGDAIDGAAALGFRGLNVTVPHKHAAAPFLTRLDETAAGAGAVNTIKFGGGEKIGYNTDIGGITDVFALNGADCRGKETAVIGAGGGATAAAFALARMGAAEIVILNRAVEFDKAEALSEKVTKATGVTAKALRLEQAGDISPEIAVQATTVGFGAQAALNPVTDEKFYKNIKFALDEIYEPWETRFLKEARERGIVAVNGFDMLVFQAVRAYEIFMGVKVTNEHRGKLREELKTAREGEFCLK